MPTLEHTRFGTLDFTDEDVITLSGGLLGFAQSTRFLLLDLGHKGSFRWLQSLDEPALAFLVVDPCDYVQGYGIELADEEAAALQIGEETPTLVLTTASIPDSRPQDMTINLAGPIVINLEARLGRQMVVDDERIPVRHRVFGEAEESIVKAA